MRCVAATLIAENAQLLADAIVDEVAVILLAGNAVRRVVGGIVVNVGDVPKVDDVCASRLCWNGSGVGDPSGYE